MSTIQTNVAESPRPVPSPELWLNGNADRLTMRKPEVVKAFLEEHSFLIPLIEEASEKLAEYFGPETPQMLEVWFHPDDGTSELFLYVQTSLSVKESGAILDQFDWDWWLDEMPRSQNKMVISLDFI